jgi:hypothetical protein
MGGARVGKVAVAEEARLVVDHGEVSVVGHDGGGGRTGRLEVTMEEVHRGGGEQAGCHLLVPGADPPTTWGCGAGVPVRNSARRGLPS